MEDLYIVEFEVAREDRDSERAFADVLGHVRQWVDPAGAVFTADEVFHLAGRRSVARRGVTFAPSEVSWEWRSAPTSRAVRLTVSDPLSSSDGEFKSVVTVANIAGAVSYRHVLARQSIDGVLKPVQYEELQRPGLVQRVMEDSALECRNLGLVVDGRYQRVGDAQELALLQAMLQQGSRLPILVVDTVKRERLDFAKESAQRLAGLAAVYCIPSVSLVRDFNGTNSDWAVPFSGARLIWPSTDARHPVFYEDETNHRNVSRALRMLAGVSVAARGLDRWWARATRAQDAHLLQEAARAADLRLAEATQAGDRDLQISVLEEELEAERAAHSRTRVDFDTFLDEFDRPDVKALRSENHQLRESLKAANFALNARSNGFVASGSWDAVPDLERDSLAPLADWLHRKTGGAITFTPAALRSWERSNYPHVARMSGVLVRLAEAAEGWRECEGVLGMAKAEWMRTTYELTVAYKDDGLVNAGKDTFEFEGAQWSRIPHVKVDDHVSPNEVGRIYFAEDLDGMRFIVDHVGLKLYGL